MVKKSGDSKSGSGLLSDMVLKEPAAQKPDAGLLVESEAQPPEDSFNAELERSLTETEAQAIQYAQQSQSAQAETWVAARGKVEAFQPVPWFIWRLANYVFGPKGEIRPIGEGHVLGLRRLLFAAASDKFFGSGEKVNSVRTALTEVKPDVLAAVSVIHAICRRLAGCQFDRIWRPILDDAVLRSQIGFFVGERNERFGAGRGMLAGFAGRCGLAILIAGGNLEQARRSLEMLAGGTDISLVGVSVYGCDPLQVSAMTLSACGCGRDAAFGTVSYASSKLNDLVQNEDQLNWLAAFAVVELVRMGREREIQNRHWEALRYMVGQDRGDLVEVSKTLIRKGHSLSWLL